MEVEIEAAYDDVVARLPRAMGRLEPLGDDRTRLVGSTSNPEMYAEWLAAVPVAFRVVGGPELTRAVRATAERLLASVDRRTLARVSSRRAGPARRR